MSSRSVARSPIDHSLARPSVETSLSKYAQEKSVLSGKRTHKWTVRTIGRRPSRLRAVPEDRCPATSWTDSGGRRPRRPRRPRALMRMLGRAAWATGGQRHEKLRKPQVKMRLEKSRSTQAVLAQPQPHMPALHSMRSTHNGEVGGSIPPRAIGGLQDCSRNAVKMSARPLVVARESEHYPQGCGWAGPVLAE